MYVDVDDDWVNYTATTPSKDAEILYVNQSPLFLSFQLVSDKQETKKKRELT